MNLVKVKKLCDCARALRVRLKPHTGPQFRCFGSSQVLWNIVALPLSFWRMERATDAAWWICYIPKMKLLRLGVYTSLSWTTKMCLSDHVGLTDACSGSGHTIKRGLR